MSVKSLAKIEGYFYVIFVTKTYQKTKSTSVILSVKSPTIEQNIAHRKCRQIYWRLETILGIYPAYFAGNCPFMAVKTSLCFYSIFFQIEQYYSAKLFCNLNDCIDKYKTTPHFFPMI